MTDENHEPNARTPLVVACLALAVAWGLYAAVVIRNFHGPLVGPRDTSIYEFFGYYARGHYRFGLPPELGLVTNDVGYWEGTNLAYNSWCSERDLSTALLLLLFGIGPWLQLYCAISPGIAAFGTLFLLRREVGVARAALCAFAGTFMAFYVPYKYAWGHINLVPVHWMILSVVADYVITRRVAKDAPIEAPLLLGRAALMVLTIGLDLAYVAGYALTFFTIAFAFWIGRWAIVARPRGVRLRAYFPKTPLADLAKTPLVTALAVAGILVGLLVYVPFAFAIVRGAGAYKFPDAGGNFWASWPRILLPFLPGAHPTSPWVTSLFGQVEGVAEFCVGWTLLAFGTWGVLSAKRRGASFVIAPLVMMFFVCFAFHPARFPTLHVFPWFFFNRVAGRATMVFPVLFALAALHVEVRSPRALAILLGLGVVETATAYTAVYPTEVSRLAPDAFAYFDAVRAAPGEALFDFPFCVAGGNGVGTNELCPYYEPMASVFSYQRFHDKKVLSLYVSRLHPSQVPPRIALAALFSPDDPDPHRATRESRCFDEARWSLFARIYSEHDFAGIQLATDRLPDPCVAEFHARYGASKATTILPGVGRVEFLRRK